MHFKRKRPRNRRAGCKLCKFWKINGMGKESYKFESWKDHKRRMFAVQEIEDFWKGDDAP